MGAGYVYYTGKDDETDALPHYGTPRHSGRYPWGSGEEPYQRNAAFIGQIRDLERRGLTPKQISETLDIPIREFRAMQSKAVAENRAADTAMIVRLREKGMSPTAIGKRMGLNESTVRLRLRDYDQNKTDKVEEVADALKRNADKFTYVDVGLGTGANMGVSETTIANALHRLEADGYVTQKVKVHQEASGRDEFYMVLTRPGESWSSANKNQNDIHLINTIELPDGTKQTNLGLDKDTLNVSIDSKRLAIKYNGEGGEYKDGTIELRRGVPELSLNGKTYAQVRIPVDGKYYLKGMAFYSDDLPEGKDILFNTSKNEDTIDKILKPVKTKMDGTPDLDNPFGSSVVQRYYIDPKTGEQKLSAMNMVGTKGYNGSPDKINEEGAWDSWSRTVASQFLSKQPLTTAKKQLELTYDIDLEEFEKIKSLQNSAVKKKLLKEFSDECDTKAEHLQAAAFPRQTTKLLVGMPSLKDSECYCPEYKNGEEVILIRYPHAGPFEIPKLKVNNNAEEGRKRIGNALDGIGISYAVAQRLSGADFDGDSVVVIPTKGNNFSVKNTLKGLENFDPHTRYPYVEGMKVMTDQQKGKEMGKVSNLIADMTIQGADDAELARAVRHSMVVIDAPKHKLNYKQSEIDNDIEGLKEKYQKDPNNPGKHGASTLITRAKSEARIDEVEPRKYKDGGPIDPETGELVYVKTGRTYKKTKYVKETYIDPETGRKRTRDKIDPETGKKIIDYEKTQAGPDIKAPTVTTQMRLVKDARELSTGTDMENIYADYANRMKKMANDARLAMIREPNAIHNRKAAKDYAPEVASLEAKLNEALKNKPRERLAQLIANKVIASEVRKNPDIRQDNEHYKKLRTRAVRSAREKTGASRYRWEITPREWDAIQAGALSHTKLTNLFSNVDNSVLMKLAMPKTSTSGLTKGQTALAKSMLSRGYTYADVADRFDVSTSTIKNIAKDE